MKTLKEKTKEIIKGVSHAATMTYVVLAVAFKLTDIIAISRDGQKVIYFENKGAKK